MDPLNVRRGDFLYRDTLFVEVGPNKLHPRASAQDLKELLLPRSGTPAKDQVAHWYEAQLVHYGLPHSKDKNTAKVRLTNAITAKTLVVPKEVLAIEANLKKEYSAALRKAKGGASTAAAKTNEKKDVSTKKAKTSTSRTTVELEIDGIKVKIDREAIEAAKKIAKSSETTTKTKGAKASDPKPIPATAKTSAPSDRPKPKPKAAKMSQPLQISSPEASPQPRPKQTARRGKPFSYGASSRPAPTPTQTEDHKSYSFQHDVEMDDAPPAYRNFQQQSQRSAAGVVQISGTYFFPRPPIRPFELALQIDKATDTLWGRFEIGSKQGIIYMDDISLVTRKDAPCSFGWRSEDQDTGAMKFGRGCEGAMSFDGEGWVSGQFRGLLNGEDVDFEGNLVDDDGLNVASTKRAWDEFPRKAYGRR